MQTSYKGATTFKAGSAATLTGKVVDADTGRPLRECLNNSECLVTSTSWEVIDVPVALGFKGDKSCTAETNNSGLASCSETAPTKVGSSTITMSFAGNTDYKAMTKTVKVKVTR